MGRESNFWSYIQKNMKKRWDASRHEDCVGHGVPDVSYGMQGINGWIELKAMPAYPKRTATKVRIHHFTDCQRRWLTSRGSAGGYCWVLLRIERDYLLFHWRDAWKVGEVDKAALRNLAHKRWTGSINWDELVAALTDDSDFHAIMEAGRQPLTKPLDAPGLF